MAKKKSDPTEKVKKLIFQEAQSRCPFCGNDDVTVLHIHHIEGREVARANEPHNLILVCSNCHHRITYGEISKDDVIQKKLQLKALSLLRPTSDSPKQVLSVDRTVNYGTIANVVKVSGKRSPRMNYPEGSIGADLMRKNYIDYLIDKYYKFREADKNFGAFDHAQKFHHGEIHRTIQSKFGAKTFFVPVTRFDDLASYLQSRIDQTIQGRTNRSRGYRSYKTFEEYRDEQQL